MQNAVARYGDVFPRSHLVFWRPRVADSIDPVFEFLGNIPVRAMGAEGVDVVPGALPCYAFGCPTTPCPLPKKTPHRLSVCPPAGPVGESLLTSQDPAWPRIAAGLPLLSRSPPSIPSPW